MSLPSDTVPTPARPLKAAGQSLWTRVQSAYQIADEGGAELLLLACEALDRAETLAAAIAKDGPIIEGKNGPREHPGLRQELANRAFVTRCIGRLGLDVEPTGRIGRPPFAV